MHGKTGLFSFNGRKHRLNNKTERTWKIKNNLEGFKIYIYNKRVSSNKIVLNIAKALSQ